MKKKLLLSMLALVASASAWAITDNQTYEPVNDIKVVNKWIFDRVHAGEAYTSSVICNQRARTAVMDEGIIYVSRSEEKLIIIGTDSLQQSVIHRFKVEDGSALEDLPLTLDGAPYSRFLGVASIGVDNFHHIWVAPMTSTAQNSIPVYMVNTETGELTLVVEMDKEGEMQRTDYLDVIGDLTGEQAECNIMTVAGATAEPGFPTIYRMHLDQGATKWKGGFEGDCHIDVTDFYPETNTGFSLAPIVKMVLNYDDPDAMYSGEVFYIDCFGRDPVVYDVTGTLIDTFEEASDDVKQTDKGANGVAEFSLEGRNFLAYPKAQYDKNGNGCQIYVCELGEGMALGGLTKYWQLPADSVGKVTDSGLRVHCINTAKSVDDEGNEVITLFTFKSYNGMGIYEIGKNVSGPEPTLKGDVNGDGRVNVSDVSTLINMILGMTTMDQARADVNGDGRVNVSDVSSLINIILGIS